MDRRGRAGRERDPSTLWATPTPLKEEGEEEDEEEEDEEVEEVEEKRSGSALIWAGYDTLFIDGGMLLHKAMLKNQQCALLGANYSSAIQWIAEKCEKLRLYGL